MNNDYNAAFVPILPPVRPPTSSRPSLALTNLINTNPGPRAMNMRQNAARGAQAARGAWNQLPPGAKQSIKQGIVDYAKSGISFTIGESNDGHSSGYSLSQSPNPRVTKLDTGIKPKTWTSDILDATELECSPLHMSCAKLVIPSVAGNKLADHFSRDMVPDFQSNVQANVSFNIDLVKFSATNITSTLNAVLYALQIYYHYMSIISYTSSPSNNNEGMTYLRAQITAQMIEDLTRLKRRLNNTPFPPNLLEFVRYFHSNYLTSTNQDSPMIKTYPGISAASMTNGADIATALTDMSTPTCIETLTLLRKAVPHWTMGEMFDVPIDAVYDANYYTIFSNLPFTYHDGTLVQNVPSVGTINTTIAYNTFTPNLDGLAFATTSVYNTVTSAWWPGLITVPSGAGSILGNSRRSYYESNGGKNFKTVKGDAFLIRSRQETYTLNDASTAVVSTHLSGTDRCMNVNINSLTETANNAIDYLMSWDTIAPNPVKSYNQENKYAPKARKDSANVRRK